MKRLVQMCLNLLTIVIVSIWVLWTTMLIFWAVRSPLGAEGIAYGIAHLNSTNLLESHGSGGFRAVTATPMEARAETTGFFLAYTGVSD